MDSFANQFKLTTLYLFNKAGPNQSSPKNLFLKLFFFPKMDVKHKKLQVTICK